MKRLTSLLTALALTLAPFSALGEGEDIKIYIDGQPLIAKDALGNIVYPIVIDGTTYLPVRSIAGAVGLNVEWDEAARSIRLSSTETGSVIAEENIFANLSHYSQNCYELLGRSAFLNKLRELMGSAYDELLFPAVTTWYAEGGGDRLTLHGYTEGREFVNEAIIEVYRSGRIDAAVLDPQSKNFGGKNAVRYYSLVYPDCVESDRIKSFIAVHATGNELGYNIIDFQNGSPVDASIAGTYADIVNSGSLTFTANGSEYKFSGKITQAGGAWCSTGGTINLKSNCAVCLEDGKPSIMFAFSGSYLTVISLSDKTKALTSVCAK